MNIVLFKDITTDEFLSEVETESKKYIGLYVDMEDAPQRKYVKDKASSINSLLKTLERARIDKSRDYKTQVEKEAGQIKERLESANEPFTLLIDEHKLARAKVLEEEKRIADEKALVIQIAADHEESLSMNKLFDFEKAETIRLQKEHEDNLKKEAAEQATIDAEKVAKLNQERIELEKQKLIDDAVEAKEREELLAEKVKLAIADAENKRVADIEQARSDEIERQKQEVLAEDVESQKREANKKYLAKVHTAILTVLVDNGIQESSAKAMIKLAAKGLLPKLSINY